MPEKLLRPFPPRPLRPRIVGLTGGIGMGKSTLANALAARGIPIHRSDDVAHELLGQGGAAVKAIAAAFPDACAHKGPGNDALACAIDRKKLGAIVFGDRAKLRELEKILHPLIRQSRRQFLARHRHACLVVFDIPLLFEAGLMRECDDIWLVVATTRVQRQRVLARPGMTPARLAQILRQQWPHARKVRYATRIIRTDIPQRGGIHALIGRRRA